MIQSVNMITTMAMNCSSTRSRMSFCDVLPEPPRIILMRPRRSTTATAPMAIGTDTWDMKSAMPGSLHLSTTVTLRGKSNTNQNSFRYLSAVRGDLHSFVDKGPRSPGDCQNNNTTQATKILPQITASAIPSHMICRVSANAYF